MKNDKAIRPAKNDKEVPITKTLILDCPMFPFAKSTISRVLDAKIVGIDISMDKFALLLREKPNNNAPVIVLPDLEVPGIKAKDCQKPMIKASLYDQLDWVRSFFPFLSEK